MDEGRGSQWGRTCIEDLPYIYRRIREEEEEDEEIRERVWCLMMMI